MSQIDNVEAMLARRQYSDMLRFTLGSAFLAEGNAKQAAMHLSKAVQMKPEYSAAWKVLGRALAADERSIASVTSPTKQG